MGARQYTPAAVWARHPRLFLAALTLGGSHSAGWVAWLGRKRHHQTALFATPLRAQRAVMSAPR